MAPNSRITVRCQHCGHTAETAVCRHINAAEDPESKARVLSGEIFLFQCPACRQRQLISFPLVYRDSRLLLCLSEQNLAVEGLGELSGRRVTSAGDFIEKAKIFDAGLDDVVVELCKFVTRGDIGKNVDLRFLKLEGADNDLIFTYPENGQMQLLSVGFQVYEDCRGIVQRNPAMRPAGGLCVVDRDWVEGFLK